MQAPTTIIIMSAPSKTSNTPFTDTDAVDLFFTHKDYMAISQRTYDQLKIEGIETPIDLIDYDKDALERVAASLRKPAKVKKGGEGSDKNDLIEQEPFILSAKSFTRLEVAHRYLKYLETTGHLPTTSNTHWVVLKHFEEEWQAIQARKKESPTVPVMTKGLSMVKFLDTIEVHLRARIGVRGIPLLHCAREAML